MAQTTELDLDAISDWFEGKAENPDSLQEVSEWHTVRDLIAEVRRLRADLVNRDRDLSNVAAALHRDVLATALAGVSR